MLLLRCIWFVWFLAQDEITITKSRFSSSFQLWGSNNHYDIPSTSCDDIVRARYPIDLGLVCVNANCIFTDNFGSTKLLPFVLVKYAVRQTAVFSFFPLLR